MFMFMPEHYDYALMSELVYFLGNTVGYTASEVNRRDFLLRELGNKDWIKFLDSNELKNSLTNPILQIANVRRNIEESGYFGAVFVKAVEGGLSVVFAHRGTIEHSGNMEANFSIVWRRRPVEITTAATDFVRFFLNLLEDFLRRFNALNVRRLYSHTGHSLGGFIAQYIAVNSQIGKRAVTFDNPGSGGILQNYDERSTALLAYLTLPNFINMINPHIGEKWLLFTEIDCRMRCDPFSLGRNQQYNRVIPLFPLDVNVATNAIGFLLVTWQRHKIENIVNVFNPNNNFNLFPDDCFFIRRWPIAHIQLVYSNNHSAPTLINFPSIPDSLSNVPSFVLQTIGCFLSATFNQIVHEEPERFIHERTYNPNTGESVTAINYVSEGSLIVEGIPLSRNRHIFLPSLLPPVTRNLDNQNEPLIDLRRN